MYDEQISLRKAQDPTSSWSSVEYELWLMHMNNITSSPGTGNQMFFLIRRMVLKNVIILISKGPVSDIIVL